MSEKYQSNQPVRIHYDRIIPKDGYVTGVAQVSSPSGMGEFEVLVSGQELSVFSYQEQAQIFKLEMTKIDDPGQIAGATRQAALEARRGEWVARLEQMRIFVENADLEQLSDPEWIDRFDKAVEKPGLYRNLKEDLARDRLIEIRPLEETNPGETHRLSLTIHPEVLQGSRDIYRPVIQGAASASAQIDVFAGDADLELYREGNYRDGSYSTGASDSVYAEGGAGRWKLHVIGYTNATYELSGDWILQ
jgi:hypothetical protein